MSIYKDDVERICVEPLPFKLLKESNVLITGANGLIASCMVDVIMRLNEINGNRTKVFALCRNLKKAKERFAEYKDNSYFVLVEADVTDPIPVNIKCQYILHAASNAHPLMYATQPVETITANILGTFNLMEYARIVGSKRMLFISSSEIYGENNLGAGGNKETDVGYLDSMKVRSCYPESKRAAETLCVSYDAEYNIETVVARPGYIYGINANENNTRADIQFMIKAVNGQDIVLKSEGLQRRSYCYLADAVCGMFYILLFGKRGHAYNIANKSSNVTIREFAHALAQEAGVQVIYDIPDNIEKQGYSTIQNSVLNADKLESLGWKPTVSLQEGVHRLFVGRKEFDEI